MSLRVEQNQFEDLRLLGPTVKSPFTLQKKFTAGSVERGPADDMSFLARERLENQPPPPSKGGYLKHLFEKWGFESKEGVRDDDPSFQSWQVSEIVKRFSPVIQQFLRESLPPEPKYARQMEYLRTFPQNCQESLGRYSQQWAEYDQLLNELPEDVREYLKLSSCRSSLGQRLKALRKFDFKDPQYIKWKEQYELNRALQNLSPAEAWYLREIFTDEMAQEKRMELVLNFDTQSQDYQNYCSFRKTLGKLDPQVRQYLEDRVHRKKPFSKRLALAINFDFASTEYQNYLSFKEAFKKLGLEDRACLGEAIDQDTPFSERLELLLCYEGLMKGLKRLDSNAQKYLKTRVFPKFSLRKQSEKLRAFDPSNDQRYEKWLNSYLRNSSKA